MQPTSFTCNWAPLCFRPHQFNWFSLISRMQSLIHCTLQLNKELCLATLFSWRRLDPSNTNEASAMNKFIVSPALYHRPFLACNITIPAGRGLAGVEMNRRNCFTRRAEIGIRSVGGASLRGYSSLPPTTLPTSTPRGLLHSDSAALENSKFSNTFYMQRT